MFLGADLASSLEKHRSHSAVSSYHLGRRASRWDAVCSDRGVDIEEGFKLLAAQATTPSLAAAWVRAARAFFQSTSGGRSAIDDSESLREVADLVKDGRSEYAALTRVARRLAGHHNSKPVYERLRRKWKCCKNTTH
jgi:hypothetical protein